MALTRIATLRLSNSTNLIISRGSVLHFGSSRDAAIVNAANQGCLGGGGVDGAISAAGGNALFEARLALPIVRGRNIRCPTGAAKITGPGKFGSLATNYVIHAVGPNYHDFFFDEYERADELLKEAYQSSLNRAMESNLREVAFSLLSAGVFRGRRSLKQILSMGVDAIHSWCKDHPGTSVKEIHMCAFTKSEADILVDVAHLVVGGVKRLESSRRVRAKKKRNRSKEQFYDEKEEDNNGADDKPIGKPAKGKVSPAAVVATLFKQRAQKSAADLACKDEKDMNVGTQESVIMQETSEVSEAKGKEEEAMKESTQDLGALEPMEESTQNAMDTQDSVLSMTMEDATQAKTDTVRDPSNVTAVLPSTKAIEDNTRGSVGVGNDVPDEPQEGKDSPKEETK